MTVLLTNYSCVILSGNTNGMGLVALQRRRETRTCRPGKVKVLLGAQY